MRNVSRTGCPVLLMITNTNMQQGFHKHRQLDQTESGCPGVAALENVPQPDAEPLGCLGKVIFFPQKIQVTIITTEEILTITIKNKEADANRT